MATTAIWKITNRLNKTLEYTTNPNKTIEENYSDLHKSVEYIKADYKTEKQCYVSGINCNPGTAFEEMIITKKQFSKENGIQGFHAFQSFKENELTPEMCHRIGVEFAQEMWGDRFEVVVSTHLNTNHLHNHFIINSVSFLDGKKYYDNRSNYSEMRRISDSICEEYGLSIIKEKTCKKSKVNYRNYQIKQNQNDNYYSLAKKDLDKAIGMAIDYYDFESLMRAMDYKLIYRGNNQLSIRRYPYKKNIRVSRYFGNEYSMERIKERIEEEQLVRIPFLNESRTKHNSYYYKNKKVKGIYALYIHYCYLLKVFPKKFPYQKLSPAIRIDVSIMEEISKETRFLVKNNLKTDETFLKFKKELETNKNDLIEKRIRCWERYKKTDNDKLKKEIEEEINQINLELTPIKEKVNLCENILKRSFKLEKNIKELYDEENIKRKEVNKNEYNR